MRFAVGQAPKSQPDVAELAFYVHRCRQPSVPPATAGHHHCVHVALDVTELDQGGFAQSSRHVSCSDASGGQIGPSARPRLPRSFAGAVLQVVLAGQQGGGIAPPP